MIKYLHIGYPKNFSTSLQRDYFSKNEDLFHLGIGINDNLGYVDDVVNSIFEVYLKTCKRFKYQQKISFLKSHILDLHNTALAKGYKAFGASSEHLSFAFTYDGLSTETKANRLFELFGKDTKIIIILRNQIDLLKSLFRESVRVGFKGDYEYFLYLFYKYQDRNYYSDLNYDHTFKVYSEIFGEENISVLFFENYRPDNQLLLDKKGKPQVFNDLDDILKINSSAQFDHYNEALNYAELNSKVNLNKRNSHDLGNHMYETAEKHRLKSYLENELKLTEENNITYGDVLIKRKLISLAKTSAETNNSNEEKLPRKFKDQLRNDFSESNLRLKKLIDTELPTEYLNLGNL